MTEIFGIDVKAADNDIKKKKKSAQPEQKAPAKKDEKRKTNFFGD